MIYIVQEVGWSGTDVVGVFINKPRLIAYLLQQPNLTDLCVTEYHKNEGQIPYSSSIGNEITEEIKLEVERRNGPCLHYDI